MRAQWDEVSWQAARLGNAFEALVRHSGISKQLDRTSVLTGLDENTGNEIASAAERLGCEVERVYCNWKGLSEELAAAAPGLIALPHGRILVTLRSRRGKLQVLQPDSRKRWIRAAEISAAIQEPAVTDARAEFLAILDATRVHKTRSLAAVDLLVREHLGERHFDQSWILRRNAASPLRSWLSQVAAFRNGAVLVGAHSVQYLLWILSWIVMGSLALGGRLDLGWLLAWALLLVTIIPFRLIASHAQAALATGVAGLLKRRLLRGVLRLAPQEMKHYGIGSFLGQVFESESVEALAINGAISGLLAIIEVAVAAAILGRYSVLLFAWCLVAGVLGWSFMQRFRERASGRMELTHDLVESMVGHRTRLVQQSKENWHDDEDRALNCYFAASRAVDRSGVLFAVAVPRAWLITAIMCAPVVVSGRTPVSALAVLVGGTLLAYGALRRLTGAFVSIVNAAVSCQRIRPVFDAASRQREHGELLPGQTEEASPLLPVLEADHLTYRYENSAKPAVQDASFTVRRGDRLLVEGPSGGGKSTLAALLAGLREPQSGLLLSGGLDRHTLGDEGWRKRIASAPQFHDNHVLTETFAFNLLMGRCWPPQPGDLEEAEDLCHRLGLGELLDRMPGGMMQMVGECGWRLSHGEKSRLYIARALLQKAHLIVLDESFAALDPKNTYMALQCALQCSETLIVIAHP